MSGLLLLCFPLLLISQSPEQTIKGIVIDQNSEAPLIGATVIIRSDDFMRGIISDEQGIFRLENVPVGRYYIEARYIGYEPRGISEVMVTSARPAVLEFRLMESVSEMEGVEIKAQTRKDIPINLMAVVSSRTFTVEETRRFAGGFDDPGRIAAAFAGVAGGSPNDNALSIRGNAPKSLLWRVEGVSVPNPNHFAGMLVEGGGIVSLVSGQLLNNSDFFTGAFPAEYGNALSGVFDMNLRAGNNEDRGWGLQVGTLGLEGFGEGPFTRGGKASYLFNYRYSSTALFKDLLPEGQAPIFQDLSFKLNFPTKRGGTFSVWGLGGLDINSKEPLEDSTMWRSSWDQTRYVWKGKTGIVSAKHKIIFGGKTVVNTSVTGSYSQFSDSEKLSQPGGSFKSYHFAENITTMLSLSSVMTHKFNHHFSNRTGFVLSRISYDILLREAPFPGADEIEFAKEDGATGYLQSFSQFRCNVNKNLTFNAGVHSMLFLLNNSATLEPRMGISYTFLSGNSLNFAYGNHSHIEPLQVYFYRYEPLPGEIRKPNLELIPSRSHHYVLGYSRLLGDNFHLNAETYYQQLYNIPVEPGGIYSLANFKQEYILRDSLSNTGTGTNMGFDLTLEQFLLNNYYFLVTGSLIDSKYVAGDGNTYNTRWDYGYVLNLLGGREFYLGKKKDHIMGINGRVVFQGGERTHPVDLQATIDAQGVRYDYERAWEARFPNTFFVDFTATLRVNKPKYSSTWGIQIKNLLFENSIFYYNFNDVTQEVEIDGMGFIFPNVSYKIEF